MNPARNYSITIKSFALALVVAFYTAGYLYINRLNACRSRYHDVSLWFEKDLPFVPPMILGYSLVFALVAIVYMAIDNMPDLWNICIRFVNMTLICFAVFLIWPVRMNFRPEVAVTGDWITTWVGFYFWLDRPYNLFPSMHLAASFFSAFYLLKKGPVLGWTAMAMAVVVGVSVVLLKQHYILDVVAGFLVAWVCAFFSFRQVKAKFLGNLDYQNR